MKKENLLVSFISELSDIESQLNILLNITSKSGEENAITLSEVSLDNLSQKLDRLGLILIKLSTEYQDIIYTDNSENKIKATDYLAGFISISLFKTLTKIITTINSDTMLNTAILGKLSTAQGKEAKHKILIDLLSK